MHYLKPAGAALLLLLTGCAAEEEPEGVIPQGYKDAQGKAQSVESKLQDAAQQRMEAVNESDE